MLFVMIYFLEKGPDAVKHENVASERAARAAGCCIFIMLQYIIQRNLDDEQMDFQNDCMHQKYIGKESWIQELKIEKRACRKLQKPIKRVTLYKHCLKNLCLNLIADEKICVIIISKGDPYAEGMLP